MPGRGFPLSAKGQRKASPFVNPQILEPLAHFPAYRKNASANNDSIRPVRCVLQEPGRHEFGGRPPQGRRHPEEGPDGAEAEMDRESAWEIFMQTGKVADYLRYAGMQGQVRRGWEPDDGGDPEENADDGRGGGDTGAQHWRG